MSELSQFRFLQPEWLLALPLLWAMVWLFARHNLRRSMWNRLCDPQLLERMQASRPGAGNGAWLAWSLVCIVTLATLAAAGPGWRKQTQPLLESASARVVALDLSRAMLVEDVKPSRFAHALAAIREIIGTDFDGETGLVVFSGAAFVVSPLSRDSGTLEAFVESLRPGMMPLEGTRIDLAIELAQDLLSAAISGTGQVVVIASGVEQAGRAIETAADARRRGNQVSIMAIGTRAGGPMIEANGKLARDTQGGYRLARTNFSELQKIAAAGGGALVSLTHATVRDQLLGSRVKAGILAAGQAGAGDDREAANEGYWLVWLMLPFALVLFRKNLLWMLLAAVLLPTVDEVHAAATDSPWIHRENLAYQAYRQGDFQLAAELSANPLLRGAAHYRRGQHAQALKYFSLGESASALYNRGNALAQLDRLPEAVEAFAKALELEPGFAEARYNKRLVELFLEQQEQAAEEEAEDAADEAGAFDPAEQSGSESQVGATGQFSNNPGDQQQLGPGLGASMQSGMIDPFEEFGDGEQPPERITVLEYLSQPRAQRQVESWITELPVTSSELFRRKFLRDYQRQLRQSR